MWKVIIQRDEEKDTLVDLSEDTKDHELINAVLAVQDIILRRGYRSVKVVMKGGK